MKTHGLLISLESIGDEVAAVQPTNDTGVVDAIDPRRSDPANTDPIIEVGVELHGEYGEFERAEIEVLKQEHVVLQAAEQIGDALEVAEKLKEATRFAERAIDEGGLTKQSQEILQLATEALMERLGMEKSQMHFPALESFTGPTQRWKSSQISLETLKEQAAKVLKAIIQALANYATKILEGFTRVASQANVVKIRVGRVKRALPSFGGQPAEAQIQDELLGPRLTINGVVPANFMKAVSDLQTAASEAFSYGKRLAGGDFSKLYIGATSGGIDINDFVKILQPPVNGFFKKVNEDEGLVTVEGPKMLGDAVISASMIGGGGDFTMDEFDDILMGVNVGITYDRSRKIASKLPVLPIQDIDKILDIVNGLLEQVEGYRSVAKEAAENRKKLASAANQLINKISESDNEDERLHLDTIRAGLVAANKVLGEPGTAFSRYVVSTCDAIVTLCVKSMKQYEGFDRAKKPAAPAEAPESN